MDILMCKNNMSSSRWNPFPSVINIGRSSVLPTLLKFFWKLIWRKLPNIQKSLFWLGISTLEENFVLKIHPATTFIYHEIYPKLVRNDCVIKNNGSLSDSKSIPSSANDTVNFCPQEYREWEEHRMWKKAWMNPQTNRETTKTEHVALFVSINYLFGS